ncbi:MAG: efflux RND transporter permease subunit [Gemmataceae bacterium]|nr:efflux RND transporter permease subunit [Gemmataceae bacterium]
MIEKLIELSIRNRYLVMGIAAVLTVCSLYAVLNTPMDAIPDLSENQVIVFTDWMGRSPQEVEDQVTYPLSLKLQGLAGVKAVRSTSEFNYSMITVIFEDDVGFYFARERVLEKLSLASTFLPQGVVPYLAPDETALGQIFWYTLEGGKLDPGRLWALQKFYVGPEINSVPGVAEVGISGGIPFEYQIDVDPNSLRAHGITLGELYEAVARSNGSVGGRVIQKSNAEYLVRSIGWVRNTKDLENAVIKESGGVPIYVKNVAIVQVGAGFRRNVYEKGGSETVGGVVVMRHGENPLAVIDRVRRKIQDLQPALPEGVHIVPAYDRSHLIHGAIETLTEVMWHETLIASIAILLILMHFRSVFVICVTLPLSVLFSFLMMWLLRKFHVIDVQANIMSLAGITISLGILVDQAIVMVENATHHLKEHFGDKPVTGDTTEIVIRACRMVGRPIFFSVLIILLSFVPVFSMSGREGKLFHPMAITKSLAMVGVAIISVTLVPALIPGLIRGKLKSEEDNWIVRSFINIYKPLLTWALPRRNLVMWAFAALLILAAGMFPLPALLGLGAAFHYWQISFFCVLSVVTFITVMSIRGWHWQIVSFLSLVLIGLWAHGFTKIGVEFMPALNEGTVMDMPITVPRASITQVADDLRARNALLRGFPEVESVIGKAGRADTPTDPAPLDMVETFVNYRPREIWPKRAIRFEDASRQVRAVLTTLEERESIFSNLAPLKDLPAADRKVKEAADERDAMINDATMTAVARFDETLRTLAQQRYREFQIHLAPVLTRTVVDNTVRRFEAAKDVEWTKDVRRDAAMNELAASLAPRYGKWLSESPALEDVTRITQAVADRLSEAAVLKTEPAAALALKEGWVQGALHQTAESLGVERRTFQGEVLRELKSERLRLWKEHIGKKVNWELFDRGVEAFTWLSIQELAREASKRNLLQGAKSGPKLRKFLQEANKADQGEPHDPTSLAEFVELRRKLQEPFAKKLFLWRRDSGPKGDLLQELDTVVQVPGWSNIWTQPIANRIDMLTTGVRTQIGVRVFGPDLASIDTVCKEIEQALKPLEGARDVIAEPIMGEGYLEIHVDREKAARYGVSVMDIQDTIEVALGGKVITQTVEGRDRFPVRVRYARDFREDEQQIKRLLVSRVAAMGNAGAAAMSAPNGDASGLAAVDRQHVASPEHLPGGGSLQVPLGEVADVKIVEGPTMIKSENGRLRNYVTLNVRGDRDIIGFVEEAQRVVAEKVRMPAGVHIEWAGEFEHQVRAARTLRIIFPVVGLLIFVTLYFTYKDFVDALLMMMAVPEALAGGIFFQFLFPKIMHGWSAPPVEFSLAIWVGYIAAFGMATETGIIMLVYLREAIDKRGGLENIKSLEELREAVIEGAVHRLRPKLLTEGVAIVAIAPMLFSTGVGSEIISAMALPVLGGLLIADEVVDIFLPVRFYWVRRGRWLKIQADRLAAKGEATQNAGPAAAEGVAADSCQSS